MPLPCPTRQKRLAPTHSPPTVHSTVATAGWLGCAPLLFLAQERRPTTSSAAASPAQLATRTAGTRCLAPGKVSSMSTAACKETGTSRAAVTTGGTPSRRWSSSPPRAATSRRRNGRSVFVLGFGLTGDARQFIHRGRCRALEVDSS